MHDFKVQIVWPISPKLRIPLFHLVIPHPPTNEELRCKNAYVHFRQMGEKGKRNLDPLKLLIVNVSHFFYNYNNNNESICYQRAVKALYNIAH